MSGIAKAVKTVFKSVAGVVKKVWKPLVVAAAIYFTGGAALGAMGVIGGGATGLAGAAAGLSSAAGAIGIGGGAAAAGAGALEGGAATALGAGAAEASPWLAGSVLADAGAGAGLAGGAAAEGAGLMGGVGMLSSLGGDAAGTAAGTAATGASFLSPTTAASSAVNVAPTSSLWDQSLSMAGKIMTTPGMPSLIGGILQGYQQGKNLDAQEKWAEAHAPGNIAGGAANAWNNQGGGPGFAVNANLQPNTPMPTPGKLPALNPYTQGSPQVPQLGMPGYGQPGSNSQRYPGYGTPGYGQQPGVPGQSIMPGQEEDNGLLSQTPFIDSPYDQSYA